MYFEELSERLKERKRNDRKTRGLYSSEAIRSEFEENCKELDVSFSEVIELWMEESNEAFANAKAAKAAAKPAKSRKRVKPEGLEQ